MCVCGDIVAGQEGTALATYDSHSYTELTDRDIGSED